MAYGVIMGQTPILSASGIKYDNSQTASVITGNNVQDAIDQTVGAVQSKFGKITLIKEIPIKQRFQFTGINSFQEFLSLRDISRDILKESLALIILLKGNITSENPEETTIAFCVDNENFMLDAFIPVNASGNSSTTMNTSALVLKKLTHVPGSTLKYYWQYSDVNFNTLQAKSSYGGYYNFDLTLTIYSLTL